MGSTTEDVVDNEQQVQPMEVELDQASAGASACLSRSGVERASRWETGARPGACPWPAMLCNITCSGPGACPWPAVLCNVTLALLSWQARRAEALQTMCGG